MKILELIRLLLPMKRNKNGKAYCPANKHYCFPIDKSRDGKCACFQHCEGLARVNKIAKAFGTIKEIDVTDKRR